MLKAVIDTETLSLRTSAVILSIGLTVFDDTQVDTFEDLVNRGINIFIDKESQKRAGRRIDPETLEWWGKQGPEASEVLKSEGMHPMAVLFQIEQYVSNLSINKKHLKWYCRGPQFDIAKLEDLFVQFGLNVPWHYRKPRCSRTWLDEHGIDDDVRVQRPEGMIPHNSLHDSAFEAYMMQRALNGIELSLAQ